MKYTGACKSDPTALLGAAWAGLALADDVYPVALGCTLYAAALLLPLH